MRRVIEAGILTAIAERIAAATRAERPAHPLRVDGWAFGYVDEGRYGRLAAFSDVFEAAGDGLALHARWRDPAARTAALAGVARTLADEGALTAWRDERYAVARRFEAPPLFVLERAAARYFGIQTYAAHANGLVGSGPAARMWLARRSPGKAIDPGRLDNLVGGGMAAGEAPLETLVREAWEEAGIPAGMATHAQAVGLLSVERIVPDGYQREIIHAYDLDLPADFVPANQDGEVTEHRRVTFDKLAPLLCNVEGRDVVTLDATVVALDCLRRHATRAPGAARLGQCVRRRAPPRRKGSRRWPGQAHARPGGCPSPSACRGWRAPQDASRRARSRRCSRRGRSRPA
jgi:8-oxo-dGTP pyrophosphatase MutT (NUDIX family)